MQLEALIADLLFTNDCVVLPGFGGFVAKYKGAALNETIHAVYPPQKTIGFNPQIHANDGLLISAFSSVKNLSYNDAKIEVENWVNQQHLMLQRGEKLVWNQLGVLFQDRTGKLQFIPDGKMNFSIDSFGLQRIQLTPVIREEKVQVTSEPIPSVEIETPTQAAIKKGSSVVWKVAAVLAFPLLGIGIFAASSKLKNTDWQYASFKLFGIKSRISEYTPNERKLQLSNNAIEETADSTFVYHLESQDVQAALADHLPAKKEKPKFEIIVGAFSVHSNAANYVKQLKEMGFPAYEAGRKGNLQLVALQSAEDKKTAVQLLDSAKAKVNLSAWLKEN